MIRRDEGMAQLWASHGFHISLSCPWTNLIHISGRQTELKMTPKASVAAKMIQSTTWCSIICSFLSDKKRTCFIIVHHSKHDSLIFPLGSCSRLTSPTALAEIEEWPTKLTLLQETRVLTAGVAMGMPWVAMRGYGLDVSLANIHLHDFRWSTSHSLNY